MKFMLSLLALGYVALANPIPSLPLHPGGIGGLFKGPNSETIIKGPDGSVITAVAEGGDVKSEIEPIVVVQDVAPVVTTVVEPIAVSPTVVENKQSSDLIGPSGRIATEGLQAVIAGPSSTTIAGTAVVAETVVKGPVIVGTPVVTLTGAAPVVTVTGATPVVTATATPISITAAPNADLAPTIVTAGSPSIATVTAGSPSIATVTAGTPPIATVTATPPVSIVTPSPQPVATAAALSQPVATAAALPQAVVTASASPHALLASATSSQGAAATASASPNQAAAVVTVPDQIAIDNRQLILNPALIPPANIVPSEIVVTPKYIPRLRPTPPTLLTTPGLGAVAASTNIQREEGDAVVNVTPNNVLTQQQLLQLQNQQNILNNQIQHAQQAAAAGVPTPARLNGGLLTTKEVALADIQQQQLLSAELAKSGIDVAQLQLTNVPLTSVSALPTRLQSGVVLGSGGIAESWSRYGRNAESVKKSDDKKKD